MVCEISSESVWLRSFMHCVEKLPCVQWFTVKFECLVGWGILLVGNISAMQVKAKLERFCTRWRPRISGNNKITAEGAGVSWVKKRCGIFLCNQFGFCHSVTPVLLLLGNRANLYLNVFIETPCIFPTKVIMSRKKLSWELQNFLENLMWEFLSSCLSLWTVLCSLDKLRWTFK